MSAVDVPAVVEVAAAIGFGYLAASFVSEPESWPVFLAWVDSHAGHELAVRDRETAERLLASLATGMEAVTQALELLQ